MCKRICKNCRYENEKGANYCQICGQPLHKSSTSKKVIAATIGVIAVVAVYTLINLFAHDYDFEKPENDKVYSSGEGEYSDIYGAPVFGEVFASSVLEPQYGNYYGAENTLDGNAETAWAEGVTGQGEGENIKYTANTEQCVSGIRILNGYSKSKDIYVKNSRIKELEIVFDDGSSEIMVLDDEYGVYQSMKFDSQVMTTSVELYIISVYPGTNYEDTCVSEVEFY